MALGQGPQALLTTLYRSTDCLCRRGAAMKNLAQSASPHAGENNAPLKPGTKQVMAAARANRVGVMGIRAVQAGALTAAIDRPLPADHPEVRDYERAAGFRRVAAELDDDPAVLAHRYAAFARHRYAGAGRKESPGARELRRRGGSRTSITRADRPDRSSCSTLASFMNPQHWQRWVVYTRLCPSLRSRYSARG